MGIFKFELKKNIVQKKFLWLLIIVLFFTTANFWLNLFYKGEAGDRAYDEIKPLIAEWERRERALIELSEEHGLNEMQKGQLENTREMIRALERWRVAIQQERWGREIGWDEIPGHQQRFLESLQKYADFGGEFTALEGVDREIAIAKNAWLLEYDLPYEVESYPLSPHLFTKGMANIFFGLAGLIIILLLYGNSLTEEKENNTWLTLKTQPIKQYQLISAKYFSIMLMVFLFILLVMGIGLILPLFGGESLRIIYPKVLVTGDEFTIITTGEYLIRATILFICASSFSLSINLFLSKWVKKTFTSYLLIGSVLSIGFFGISIVKSPLNPFYMLRLNEIVTGLPLENEWLFIPSAIIWSIIFLLFTIILPDKEISIDIENNKKPFNKGETKVSRKLLYNLSTFEWRKIKREGLFKQAIIFLLIFTIASYCLLTYQTNQKRVEYFVELDSRIDNRKEQILRAEGLIDDTKNQWDALVEAGEETNEHFDSYQTFYGNQIDRWEEDIEFFNFYLDTLHTALTAYEEGSWNDFYQYQLFAIEKVNEEDNFGSESSHINSSESFTKEVSIEEKKWLMDRDIQPVFSGEYIPNIYKSWWNHELQSEILEFGWGGEIVGRTQWEYENSKMDNSGLFSLYHLYEKNIYLLPVILLLFLLGGGMATEKGKRSTINMLKTQPLAMKKLYLAKFINAATIIAITCLVLILLIVTIGTVYNRFGDWDYPILHYNTAIEMNSEDYTGLIADGKGYHFMYLGRYLVSSTVLLMFLGLFLIALSLFISIFFSNSMGVFASTALISGAGYWLGAQTGFSHLSPFAYFDIPKIANGELATLANNPSINVQIGSILLFTLTLALVVAGYILSGKEKSFDIFILVKSWLRGTKNGLIKGNRRHEK